MVTSPINSLFKEKTVPKFHFFCQKHRYKYFKKIGIMKRHGNDEEVAGGAGKQQGNWVAELFG
jgi:hypothetical protein